MPTFNELVWSQLLKMRVKKRPIYSYHEGASIVREEYEEFWDEVKLKSEKRNPERILAELIDVVCGCQRIAEDMGLVDVQLTREEYQAEQDKKILDAKEILTRIAKLSDIKENPRAKYEAQVQKGVFNGVRLTLPADLCKQIDEFLA